MRISFQHRDLCFIDRLRNQRTWRHATLGLELASCANNAKGRSMATNTENTGEYQTRGEAAESSHDFGTLVRHSYACGERTGVGGRKWPNPSRHAKRFLFARDQPFYPNFSGLQLHFSVLTSLKRPPFGTFA